MKPGECFGRRYFVAQKVVCRSGPAQSGETPPLRTLALRKSHQPLAEQAYRRLSVGLRAEPGAMSNRPGIDLSQVILVDQFCERLSPDVANGFRFRGAAGNQFRQMGQSIVTTTLAKRCR